MPDMIPAAKVAAAALHQVQQAGENFPETYHDSGKVAKAKVHLQVATELLALIAEPGPRQARPVELPDFDSVTSSVHDAAGVPPPSDF